MVISFVACSGSAGAPGPPELTQAYGCGHGFYLGDEPQSVGLFIWSDAGYGESMHTGTYGLPADGWTAELRFGTDLFANWCDDVVEPGEPEPIVNEIWEVGGVFELIELPAGECGPARGTLVEGTARAGDGEEIALGNVELSNETWGCFAG